MFPAICRALEEFHLLANDRRKDIVCSTRCADAEQLVCEPFLSENLADERIVANGIIGRRHAARHLESHLASRLLVIFLNGMEHHVSSLESGARINLACRRLDEIRARIHRQDSRVAIEKARENGKPEHLIEKIAEGSVNKFLKEVTLLSQPFVKDDSKSVGELLKSNGATVSAFALFVVGEGLEKRNDDFAAEVAAQAAAARA